ncbi:aminopeptidase YpdF [Geomicrobium sp. JCM 19039]|nr:aminopeptidase YpdF [Geomicrobium sp. JCM 19039]
MLISQDRVLLFTDFRYIQQAEAQASDHAKLIEHKGGLLNEAVYQELRLIDGRVGVEGTLDLSTYNYFNREITNFQTDVIDASIMSIRKIKDPTEIANIREGIRLYDLAFEYILGFIKPGMSELEIGLELEYHMKKNGAEAIKANHVIASGERSSLPHGAASKRIVNKGEFIRK